MRLTLTVLTLTLMTLTFSASADVSDPLAGLLIRRQLPGAPGSDESSCAATCEKQLSSQQEPAIEKCGQQASNDPTALQKCFCQAGIYAATAACIDKCFQNGTGHDAEDAIKQRCADLGVGTGSGTGKADDSASGAKAPNGDNGASAGAKIGIFATLALVGAVAITLI